MKGQDISKNILLSVISLLITLLCLEFSLRIVWQNNEWWNRPPAAEQYLYPRNSYGFRDYEYQKNKPENTVRIIATGDSFTFGGGIKFDDAWPKRLERSLNVKYSPLTGKKYEVLNISWSGYSTFQEVNKLDFFKEFDPDLIILGYCLNDTEDWAREKNVIALRKKYIYRKTPDNLLKGLYHNSYFASFIALKLSNIKIAQGTKEYYNVLYEDSYSGWRRTSKSFKIFGTQEFPVFVAIFPLLNYPYEEYPFLNIHMKIKKELEKNKLSYLDYYDFFKQEDFMRLQVIPFLDPHPNEIANRIIEEHLFEKISKEYKNILGKD